MLPEICRKIEVEQNLQESNYVYETQNEREFKWTPAVFAKGGNSWEIIILWKVQVCSLRESHGPCVHCTQNETTWAFLYSVTSGRSGTKPPFLRTVAHFYVSLSWLISGACELVFQPSEVKPHFPTLQHWDFASETTNLASHYNFSIGLKLLTVLETPEHMLAVWEHFLKEISISTAFHLWHNAKWPPHVLQYISTDP